MRGTASLVMGISSDTMFMKTVRESITVTPATVQCITWGAASIKLHFYQHLTPIKCLVLQQKLSSPKVDIFNYNG